MCRPVFFSLSLLTHTHTYRQQRGCRKGLLVFSLSLLSLSHTRTASSGVVIVLGESLLILLLPVHLPFQDLDLVQLCPHFACHEQSLVHLHMEHIRTHMGHIRTHIRYIRTHMGHIRTHMGHIRTHMGHIWTYRTALSTLCHEQPVTNSRLSTYIQKCWQRDRERVEGGGRRGGTPERERERARARERERERERGSETEIVRERAREEGGEGERQRQRSYHSHRPDHMCIHTKCMHTHRMCKKKKTPGHRQCR